MINKKLIVLVLSCIMAFSLVGCSEKLTTTEDLIAKAREEITVADAETMEVQFAVKYIEDDKALMWFITGNEYQMHRYFPMVFDVMGAEEYVFVQCHKAMERGEDIAVFQWHGGYSFLVNNPKCKMIQITGNIEGLSTVTEIKIEEGEYPFHYYCELLPQEYIFLDAEGNEIQ